MATRCDGPEVFVNNRNEVLSDVDDVDALSKNIQYLYENVNMLNRQKISDKTGEAFSSEKFGEKITEIYETIL